MSDEKERSVASAGSVAEPPLGDPEIAVEILKLRVAELEQAIRRLAEQDATLTDAEREAVEYFSEWCIGPSKRLKRYRDTLRGLLERTK